MHDLKTATKITSAATEKGQVPILECLAIDGDGEKMTLIGSDLEVSIKSEANYEGSKIRCCVNAERFTAAVSQMDHPIITIKNNKLSIKYGRVRASIPVLEHDHHPGMMQDDEKGYPENFGLIELINPVAFASATKDVRFYLNGIHIEIRDGLLTATAANGHRCASITHPIRHKDASEIFPIHAFKAIGKLSGMDSTLIGNPIKLSGNSTEAYIRPLDSKYPDLKGMLKPAVTAATMNREVFLDQLRSMAAVCGKTPKMDMEWSDSSVRIAMKNSDGIESNGELDCDHEDDGKISVNAEYFIEAVSSLKEEDFTMEFPENRKYIIIQEDNLTNIVMPIL